MAQGRPWLPPLVAEEVVQDNLAFVHDLHVYSPEFNAFVTGFCHQLTPLMQFSDDANAASRECNPLLVFFGF